MVISGSLCCLCRLLRSLVSLKQVIINAAHYLVLRDKGTYHFEPGTPFLQVVSPAESAGSSLSLVRWGEGLVPDASSLRLLCSRMTPAPVMMPCRNAQ